MTRGINADEHQKLLEQPLNLEPYGTEFEEHRLVSGLIIPPDGDKYLVVTPVSPMVMELWRRQLRAKYFTIEGNMVFKANEETYKEYERIQGEGLKRIK